MPEKRPRCVKLGRNSEVNFDISSQGKNSFKKNFGFLLKLKVLHGVMVFSSRLYFYALSRFFQGNIGSPIGRRQSQAYAIFGGFSRKSARAFASRGRDAYGYSIVNRWQPLCDGLITRPACGFGLQGNWVINKNECWFGCGCCGLADQNNGQQRPEEAENQAGYAVPRPLAAGSFPLDIGRHQIEQGGGAISQCCDQQVRHDAALLFVLLYVQSARKLDVSHYRNEGC